MRHHSALRTPHFAFERGSHWQATALGLESVGTEPTVVPRAQLKRALGTAPKGELVTAMLDQKSTWDRMVARHREWPASRCAN